MLMAVATAPAQEVWEGSDDFSSARDSAQKWKAIVEHPTQGKAFVEGEEIRYRATDQAKDAAWMWGRRGHLIPSSASFQLSCKIRVPRNSPTIGIEKSKAGLFAVSRASYQSGDRALACKIYQDYNLSSGNGSGLRYLKTDMDYRPAQNQEEPEEPFGQELLDNEPLVLSFRHNALTQADSYQVHREDGTLVVAKNFQSGLAARPGVGVGIVLAGKKKLSGSGLAMDNWTIRSFDPGVTNLPAITQAGTTIGRSPWTLTITNLRLEKVPRRAVFAPRATASLAFGTNTLSIPVTGLIQTNGNFLLTGKGTGSARGYGFSLVYDTYNSVRIAERTIVTAPKQKTIKF